ncbi:MAG: hypothetical protein ACLPKI_29260 [Streptosporangiaceae bacterium]
MAQEGRRDIQRPVSEGSPIKVRKRGWQVAYREGDFCPVEHRVYRFQLLAGFGIQAPGGDKISISAIGRPNSQVNQPAGSQSPRRPHRITGAPQHADRAAQVAESLGIAAERPQCQAAPVQHLPQQKAARQLQGAVECREPGRRPACVGEGQPQGGQHVSLALRRAGPASQAQRGSQLLNPGTDIAGIAQNNSRGLMGHRCLIPAGLLGQNCARLG